MAHFNREGAEMRSQVEQRSEAAEKTVRDIRRATRRQYSAEDKVRIVIAGSARRRQRRRAVPQGRHQSESLLPLVQGLPGGRQEAAGGDTAREATSDDVKGLHAEAHQLKELLAELMLENRLLKKSVLGDGESDT